MLFNKIKQKNESFWMKTTVTVFIGCVIFAFIFLFRTHSISLPTPPPDPTPIPSSSVNITVYLPSANSQVDQNFQLTGKARVFENIVSYRIKQKLTGHIILSGTVKTDAGQMGTFGAFTQTISFPDDFLLRSGDALVLEVFQVSAKDGSEVDKVAIPVIFKPT